MNLAEIFMPVKSPDFFLSANILKDYKEFTWNIISAIASEFGKLFTTTTTTIFQIFILAVLNTLILTIIGLPHALVLGVGAALLNLIPYFGTLLGALIPLIYLLISIPDPLSMAIKAVVILVIVQFLESNIITPNIVRTNVRINALTKHLWSAKS